MHDTMAGRRIFKHRTIPDWFAYVAEFPTPGDREPVFGYQYLGSRGGHTYHRAAGDFHLRWEPFGLDGKRQYS